MKFNRVFAMSSAWTFSIKPIRELLDRYVGDGKGWVDPFAGRNSWLEFTNDINPDMPAKFHMDAEAFCRSIEGPFKGVIIDPPYSYRQISEHYKLAGRKATQLDTSSNFYNRTMNAICDKIDGGGACYFNGLE